MMNGAANQYRDRDRLSECPRRARSRNRRQKSRPSCYAGISRFRNCGSGYPDSLARKQPAPCPSSPGQAKDPRRFRATFVAIGEGWRHQRRRSPSEGEVENCRQNPYKRGSSRNVRDWRSVPRDEEPAYLKGVKSGAQSSVSYAAAGAPASEALMGCAR